MTAVGFECMPFLLRMYGLQNLCHYDNGLRPRLDAPTWRRPLSCIVATASATPAPELTNSKLSQRDERRREVSMK